MSLKMKGRIAKLSNWLINHEDKQQVKWEICHSRGGT